MELFLKFVFITMFFLTALISDAQITPTWVADYSLGFPFTVNSRDMKADKSGNIFVTGYITDSSSNYTSVTLGYSNSGQPLWLKTIDSISYYTLMTIDDSSNVYVIGHKIGEILIVKFNSIGIEQWRRSYSMGGNQYWSYDALADDSNNIFIVGNAINNRFMTLKYDQFGNLLWDKIENVANGSAKSYIDLDYNGNLYKADRGWDTAYYLCTISKYSSQGNKKWEINYSGNFNPGQAGPAGINCDNHGNIYVLAWTTNYDYSQKNVVVQQYDSSGNKLWEIIYSGTTDYSCQTSLETDIFGNVYAIANIDTGNGVYNSYTLKINSTGVLQWAKTFSIGGGYWDSPKSICADTLGNIYVTGKCVDSSGHTDFQTFKYDSIGNEVWTARFEKDPNGFDEANSISLDSAGNLYVSGSSGSNFSTSIITLKYLNVTNQINNIENDSNQINIFPNPFDREFTIHSDKYLQNAELSIYDILGEEILNYTGICDHNFHVNRVFLNPGIYFYELYENHQLLGKGKIIAQ